MPETNLTGPRGLKKLFPDRQVLLRNDHKVRMIRVGTLTQIAALLTITGLVAWTGFTTYVWTVAEERERSLITKARELNNMRSLYNQAFERLETHQALFHDVATEIGRIQASLGVLSQQQPAGPRQSPNNDFQRRVAASCPKVTPAGLPYAPRPASDSRLLGHGAQRLAAALEQLQAGHAAFVSYTRDLAEDRGSELGRTLKRLGIEARDRLLPSAMAAPMGHGGPFIPATLSGLGHGQDWDASLMTLDRRLARWHSLAIIARHVPLGKPLEDFQISSHFGNRRDPINLATGIHEGLDLVAPQHSPVMATAAGTVSHAGWRDRYGRMVEIDHGNGFLTRYAHLECVLVRQGERLERHTAVGLLGNTGRSTGPHLHYEVRRDDQPQNPLTFILAGHSVVALE